MGKKAKEHRRKVEKRNRLITQKKSAMQKAFDMLMKQQIDRLKENDGIDASLSGQPLSFNIVKSEKDIEADIPKDFVELKIEENEKEEEE